jgi:Low affinity iron permease
VPGGGREDRAAAAGWGTGVKQGRVFSEASEAEPDQPVGEGRSRGSRLLWGTDRWTGRPITALTVLAGGLVWVIVSAAYGFPSVWERIFQTLVAAVTVVMVFVIQHTQARHQAATRPAAGRRAGSPGLGRR